MKKKLLIIEKPCIEAKITIPNIVFTHSGESFNIAFMLGAARRIASLDYFGKGLVVVRSYFFFCRFLAMLLKLFATAGTRNL